MKKYLVQVWIERTDGSGFLAALVRYNSESWRPYQIGNNLYNYTELGYASRNLEKSAKALESSENVTKVVRKYWTKQEFNDYYNLKGSV